MKVIGHETVQQDLETCLCGDTREGQDHGVGEFAHQYGLTTARDDDKVIDAAAAVVEPLNARASSATAIALRGRS